MSKEFNDSFNESGEKARFIYKRNPLVENSYQIFELKLDKQAYEPAGEYTVIDTEEALELTEKKVINLIAVMNDKQELEYLGNLTKTRILFTIVPKRDGSEQQKIIFRTHNNKGVSTENAVLTLEKGVFSYGEENI